MCLDIDIYLKCAYYGAKCDFSKLRLTRDVAMYDIRSMYLAAMTGLMTCGEMTFF